MKIDSRPGYDIDLGVLNLLHPFDGRTYSRIVEALKAGSGIEFASTEAPIGDKQIDSCVNPLLARLLKVKRYVLHALELPYLLLLPFSVIAHRLLVPMRWAVAGTCAATRIFIRATNSHGNAWMFRCRSHIQRMVSTISPPSIPRSPG